MDNIQVLNTASGPLETQEEKKNELWQMGKWPRSQETRELSAEDKGWMELFLQLQKLGFPQKLDHLEPNEYLLST